MLLLFKKLYEKRCKLSYSSDLTKSRIIDCAIQEFNDNGYTNANIRNIAKNAQVTTGAIYNHFESKEKLFKAIIGEVVDNLFDLYEELHHIYDDIENIKFVDFDALFDQTIGAILDYFYDNWVEIKLLFLSSAGSAYENFCDKLIAVEENSMIDILKMQGITLDKTTLFFTHVISSASVEQLVEVVRHNLTKTEAVAYMKKIQEFYSQGMEKLF